MPRPKVQASQRLRAAEACSVCRETKKKCSGTAPCTQCQRRGLSRECFITYLPRGFRSARYRNAGLQPWNQSQQVFSALPVPAQTIFPARQSDFTNALGAESNRNTAVGNELLSPSESRGEDEERAATNQIVEADRCSAMTGTSSVEASRPRMLLSAHGERGRNHRISHLVCV